jgi:hypothetical protein
MEPLSKKTHITLLIKIKKARALPGAEPSDHETSHASQFLRFSARLCHNEWCDDWTA